MAVLSAEGGFFGTIAGRYSSGVPNLDAVLKGHRGDELRVDRVNRPPVSLTAPTLCIGMMIQPHVLQGLASIPGFRERGLLARFLYSLPFHQVGYRTLNMEPISEEIIDAYHEGIYRLLDLPFPADLSDPGAPLMLNEEALELFRRFWNTVEESLRSEGELADFTDWGNKFSGLVLRFAGILHLCVHDENDTTIGYETLYHAISIGKYAVEHMKAAFQEMGTDEQNVKAQFILDWILRHPALKYSKNELFQNLRGSRFSKAADIDVPLARLCERHYLRLQPATAQTGPGRRRGPVFQINPTLLPPEITKNAYYSLTLDMLQRGKAHGIATERRAGHPNQTKAQDAGSPEKNYMDEYFGASGEIGVDDCLSAFGHATGLVLVTRYVVKSPDMTLNGVKIEVKSSPPGQAFVHINKHQYETMHPRPDYYLPVLFDSESEMRFCAPIRYADVPRLGVIFVNEREEPCYQMERDALAPLTSPDELLRLQP